MVSFVERQRIEVAPLDASELGRDECLLVEEGRGVAVCRAREQGEVRLARLAEIRLPRRVRLGADLRHRERLEDAEIDGLNMGVDRPEDGSGLGGELQRPRRVAKHEELLHPRDPVEADQVRTAACSDPRVQFHVVERRTVARTTSQRPARMTKLSLTTTALVRCKDISISYGRW